MYVVLLMLKWLVFHHHPQPLMRCCLGHAKVLDLAGSNELGVEFAKASQGTAMSSNNPVQVQRIDCHQHFLRGAL